MVKVYTALAFLTSILAVNADWYDCEPVDYDTWQQVRDAAREAGRSGVIGPLGPRHRDEYGDCFYLDIGAPGFADQHPEVYHGYVAVLQEIVDEAALLGIVAFGGSRVVGVKMPAITQAYEVADETEEEMLQHVL